MLEMEELEPMVLAQGERDIPGPARNPKPTPGVWKRLGDGGLLPSSLKRALKLHLLESTGYADSFASHPN